MIVYPAMDLMSGKAVRLKQGRFDDATVYSDDPAGALRSFAEAGAEWAHIVDLDGARDGEPRQHGLIGSLAKLSGLKIQAGGGFRTRDDVATAFIAGIGRVVLGSIAVRNPDEVNHWIEEFGVDRICISLDVRFENGVPNVATGGWQEDCGTLLWDAAVRLPATRHLLITDIGRDGMMTGPNFDLYRDAAKRLPRLQVQASGGIRSIEDLESLPTDGAIVGKALWEGRIQLREALGFARA